MDPSINAISNGLIDRWFEAASGDTSSTDERIKLYEDTEKVANYLDQIWGNTTPSMKETITGLVNNLLSEINRHTSGEAGQLANWIARHTSYTPGSMSKIEGGAYLPLHHLFRAVLISTVQSRDSIDMMQFSYIDDAALEYVSQTKNLPLEIGETAPFLLSQMSSKEVGQLRSTSKATREVANEELVIRLNKKEITLKELGLHSLDKVIAFFGDLCYRLNDLELLDEFEPKQSILNTWFGPTIADQYQKHTEEMAHKISLHFCNLQTLTFRGPYFHVDATRNLTISFNKLNLPKLTSCEIYCNHYALVDLAFVQHLSALKRLRIDGPSSLLNFNSLQSCISLQTLICQTDKSPIDISGLKACTKLTSLILYGFNQVSDWTFLQELKDLTSILLRDPQGSLIFDHPKLENCILDGFLEKISLSCPSLKEVQIVGRKDSMTSINFMKVCPHLTVLNLEFCKEMTNIDNLNHSLKLTSIRLLNINKEQITPSFHLFPLLEELKIDAINRNFRSLKNCSNLKKLGIHDGVVDHTFLQCVPASLKQIVFDQAGAPEEVIAALVAKGIKVEFWRI